MVPEGTRGLDMIRTISIGSHILVQGLFECHEFVHVFFCPADKVSTMHLIRDSDSLVSLAETQSERCLQVLDARERR